MRISRLLTIVLLSLSFVAGVFSLVDDSPSKYDYRLHRNLSKSGKGKGGKGSKSSKKSKGSTSCDSSLSDDNGKGGKKSSKSSGKGKGGKGKGGKKGSKKGDQCESSDDDTPSPTIAPIPHTPHPAGSSFSSGDQSRPPSPVLAPSQWPPLSTSAPFSGGSLSVVLPRYVIAYERDSDAMPSRDHYIEVEDRTKSYLLDYMMSRYESSSTAFLVSFETSMYTTSFSFGDDARIQFDSTAYFSLASTDIPSVGTLETVVEEGFLSDDYLEMLEDLVNNEFSSTTAVVYEGRASSVTRSADPTKSTTSPAAIAAGAAGLTLFIVGVVLYRSRLEDEEAVYVRKSLDKPMGDGDATIAGDTFAGETYDGAVSVSPSAGPRRDEEQGHTSRGQHRSSGPHDKPSARRAWDDVPAHCEFDRAENDLTDGVSGNNGKAVESSGLLNSPRKVEVKSTVSNGRTSDERQGPTSPSNPLQEAARKDVKRGAVSKAAENTTGGCRTLEDYDAVLDQSVASVLNDFDDDQSSASLKDERKNGARELTSEEIESLLQTL